MLVELAVGDAYGAGFEYVPSAVVNEFNNLNGYKKHQKYDIGNGRYTDDTQMSLAIAELLVDKVEWSKQNIADKFVEVFKRDPREGYAGSFYKFLQEIKTGEEFLERMRPESDKSGAAMRAGPIGILPDIFQVMQYSSIQAKLTHNTPGGINAAMAASLMTHYFIYGLGKKESLGGFLESYLEGEWATPWVGSVGAQGFMSVRAAITAIEKGNSLADILKTSIAFEGDVDTVATIALAAASCAKDIEQNLPQNLLEGLENGQYGKDYLASLDSKLKLLIK